MDSGLGLAEAAHKSKVYYHVNILHKLTVLYVACEKGHFNEAFDKTHKLRSYLLCK